jgi:tetratricopeptide (TPR) repeat protein
MGDPEDYTLAETAFTKAFFYDPNVVEARVLMVMIYMARGEKKKARAEVELLEKQFPNEAPLYFVKGVVNRLDGNYDVSLKAFEKLVRLDPAARAVAAYNRARIFIYKREYDQAIAELEKGEKVEPDHPMLKIFRSGAYYYRGDKEMAIDLMGKVIAEHPEMDGIRPLFAVYLAGAGRRDDALAQLTDEALAISRADHDMAYWVASTYSILGEKELAFKWLGKAIKLGNQNWPHFEKDRSLDPLRDDPRFAELMAKAKNGD